MMPATTFSPGEDYAGKHIAVVLTIGLVLAINSVAVGGLLLYLGGAMAIAYFQGWFREDYVSILDRLHAWVEDQLALAVSRKIAV